MPIGNIQLNSAAIETDEPQQIVIGEQPGDPNAPIDELANTALPREQIEKFMLEVMEQPAWRREADKCADYYDNNQLSPELVETLKSRKQPPLIANLIKPTIDTVLGMEAKARTDWRVRPEDDGTCDDDLAEALSLKLKHAEIESRADRAISEAYGGMCKAGVGWVEVYRGSDPFRSRYRVGSVHRREIFWDWRSTQPDLSDARYLIRRRWLDVDAAIAMMPQYAELLRDVVDAWNGFDPLTETDTRLVQSWEIERDTRLDDSSWRDVFRRVVLLNEIWYRKWVRGYVMRLPGGVVREVDFKNPRHNEAIVAGAVQIEPATFQKVRLAWYAGPHMLYDVPSPFTHNHFPYVPFFGYREDLTGAPYGMIRTMISPQDEVNARKSKMLWQLNSRRVVADGDAVADHIQAAEEVARPDAYIILNKDRNPKSQFTVTTDSTIAPQQFQAMQESKQEIAETSGIFKAMLGQNSNAASGLAINSLVEQGLNSLAELNDNYAFARRLVGEMLFDMVRQDLSAGPQVVTVGEGKAKKTVPLNMPAVDTQTGQPTIVNDVRKVRVKVALDDIPSTPTYRMQQLQMLTEITKSLPPNLQGAIADFVVEATDLPEREQVAERLRMAAGIQDPEQQAAAQQQQQALQQQAAAAQEKRAQQAFVLDAAEKAAKVRKLNAEADRAVRT